MAPGFRYHLATIIGIFLALGVGIAIGSSFVQGAIVEKQTRTLTELRDQYNSQVVVAQEKIRRYADFTAQATSYLTAGKLTGLRFALVQTGDYPEVVRRVREAIEQAGGIVANETILDTGFSTRVQVSLNTLLPKLIASHPTLPNTEASVLHVLAQLLAQGSTEADLAAFDGSRLLRRDGDYTLAADYVVLIGGAMKEKESRVETIDVPLITQLKAINAKVLAAEASQADLSYVPALQSSEITTIDNADTDIGKIAFILAVRGERGNYGIKSTAQSGLLPAPVK